MKKKRIITSKIKRGSLIKYTLENIKKDYFEIIRKELKKDLQKQPGIYALYRGDRLVYVGLATRIHGRITGHLRSKRIKWDKFSLFIVKNIKYLRDLETAVVRIAKPIINKIEGRIPSEHEHYLEKLLKGKIKDKRKAVQDKMAKKEEEIKQFKQEISQIENAIKQQK